MSSRTLRRTGVLAALLSIAFGSAGDVAGQAVEIPNAVVAGGGGTVSAGAFRLTSSIGEPAAGTTSSGNTTITSGFLATFVSVSGGPGDGHIFGDGFEGND